MARREVSQTSGSMARQMDERSEARQKIADYARSMGCAVVVMHEERSSKNYMMFIKESTGFCKGCMYFMTTRCIDEATTVAVCYVKLNAVKTVDVTECSSYDEMLVKVDLSLNV